MLSQKMIIVKHPSFVMLPVDLKDETWYENSALQTLKKLHNLMRPKRFVAANLLGTSALIAVTTTALLKEMHTARVVNEMNKNVSVTLSTQSLIDKKLESKINVLEEVFVVLCQDLSNLQTRLRARCHATYDYICVTSLPYNTSQDWARVKNHLQGVWHDAVITYDMEALQKDIATISKSYLSEGSLESLTVTLEEDMKSLNSLHWLQYFIFIGILIFHHLQVVLLFPCLFRLLLKSLLKYSETRYP